MAIKHAFTSAKGDGGDASLVKPSDWNADHVGDVAAANVPIADAGNRYTGTEVETALQELAGSGRTTETVKANADAIALAVPPGVILPYGGVAAPTGFLLCDGLAKSKTTYAALFAVIGYTFGGDPGGGNFYVPNFKGVSPTGVGTQTINTRDKAGPALGVVREDVFQTHIHAGDYASKVGQASPDGSNLGASAVYLKSATQSGYSADGANGTPRTGAYTHGPEIGVNWIIKT